MHGTVSGWPRNQLDALAQAHRGGSAAIDRHKKSFQYAIYPFGSSITRALEHPAQG